jgi:hypothetical protein
VAHVLEAVAEEGVTADFAELHREVAQVWQLRLLAAAEQCADLVLEERLVVAALVVGEFDPDDDLLLVWQRLDVLLHPPQQHGSQLVLHAGACCSCAAGWWECHGP